HSAGLLRYSQVVPVPNPTLGKGVTMGSLSSTVRRVDVWAKKGDGTKSILAEDAQVVGLSNSGSTVTQVNIKVSGDESANLKEAQCDNSSLLWQVYDLVVFSGLRPNPPVRSADLQFVGHSLFALFFAWLGGLAGRLLSRGA